MNKLIFIIGRQRSGTTVLRELFMKYGAMNADEVFHGDVTREHRFYAYVAKRAAEDPKFVNPQLHGWLFRQYLKELQDSAGDNHVVLDLKYFAINAIPTEGDLSSRRPYLVSFLEERQPTVYHVIRRNKLRVYVSENIAKKTGKWSARTNKDMPGDKGKVVLDPIDAVLTVRALEDDDRTARELLANVPGKREVIYETMFQENGHFSPYVTNHAANVLGLDKVDPVPSNAKMNPEPLSQLIENYDEIASAMDSAGYQWMLKG